MKVRSQNRNWPEEPDERLDQALASLGHLVPSAGLGDAVMARLRSLQAGTRVPIIRPAAPVVRRRWTWVLSGGYALSSAASLALLATFWTQVVQFGTAMGWVTLDGLAAGWHAVVEGVANSAATLALQGLASLELLPLVAGATALAWLSIMISAFGIYRILAHYNVGRKQVHAIR